MCLQFGDFHVVRSAEEGKGGKKEERDEEIIEGMKPELRVKGKNTRNERWEESGEVK